MPGFGVAEFGAADFDTADFGAVPVVFGVAAFGAVAVVFGAAVFGAEIVDFDAGRGDFDAVPVVFLVVFDARRGDFVPDFDAAVAFWAGLDAVPVAFWGDFDAGRGDFAIGRFAPGRGAGAADVARFFAGARVSATGRFFATRRFGARFADLPAADLRAADFRFGAAFCARFAVAFRVGARFAAAFRFGALIFFAVLAAVFFPAALFFDAERLFDRRAAAIVVSGRGWGFESARGSLGGRIGKRKAEERQDAPRLDLRRPPARRPAAHPAIEAGGVRIALHHQRRRPHPPGPLDGVSPERAPDPAADEGGLHEEEVEPDAVRFRLEAIDPEQRGRAGACGIGFGDVVGVVADHAGEDPHDAAAAGEEGRVVIPMGLGAQGELGQRLRLVGARTPDAEAERRVRWPRGRRRTRWFLHRGKCSASDADVSRSASDAPPALALPRKGGGNSRTCRIAPSEGEGIGSSSLPSRREGEGIL